jgi:hypothetical protein
MSLLNHKPTQVIWPGRKAARRRVLLIAATLFPLTWIVNAFLVGSWNLLGNRDAESIRHLCEAAVVFVAAVSIVFLLTLLPTASRFFSWLTTWRIMRRCLIAFAWLVTLIALYYGVTDWQGRRAWNNYRDSLIARGDQLDFKAFIPNPIPDAENFAATPEVQSWFTYDQSIHPPVFTNAWNDNFARANAMVSTGLNSFQSEIHGLAKPPMLITDLVGWKMAFAAVQAGNTNGDAEFKSDKQDSQSRAEAATAVLEALKPIDGRLEELRMASRRPKCRYPVIYDVENPWGILLPHIANIKAVSLRLDLKACAELAVGQSDRALEDIKLNLRLVDSLNTEPFLISYLIRGAVLHVAAHSIWEGLAEHKWSDAQLKELQALLARYDFIKDLKNPFECERAAGILTADLLSESKFSLSAVTGDSLGSPGAKASTIFGEIVPRGWYEYEKLNYCRLYTLQLDGAFDVPAKRVFPQKVASGVKAVDEALAHRNPFKTILTRHQLFAAILLPALGNIPKRGAFAQVTADEALLACALERYRLAHGQFPDGLDALAPEFIPTLPHDVIGGEPYNYRRTKDNFVLYSVGWNEKDDGGQTGRDLDQGDWSWEYPDK